MAKDYSGERGQDVSGSNLNYPHQNHGSSCQEHVCKLLCHSSDSSFFSDFTIYFSIYLSVTCIGMYSTRVPRALQFFGLWSIKGDQVLKTK